MPIQNYVKLKAQWAKRRETIKRWYAAGQSMRSIANKLELSVQRVHKIVSGK